MSPPHSQIVLGGTLACAVMTVARPRLRKVLAGNAVNTSVYARARASLRASVPATTLQSHGRDWREWHAVVMWEDGTAGADAAAGVPQVPAGRWRYAEARLRR